RHGILAGSYGMARTLSESRWKHDERFVSFKDNSYGARSTGFDSVRISATLGKFKLLRSRAARPVVCRTAGPCLHQCALHDLSFERSHHAATTGSFNVDQGGGQNDQVGRAGESRGEEISPRLSVHLLRPTKINGFILGRD